ncbi:MAG TPA: M24 family metallopeptidase [Streptosporangiaceae bacterium]|nr:M24 family metallopeptidase [Streptosporangiaceae bacterium]
MTGSGGEPPPSGPGHALAEARPEPGPPNGPARSAEVQAKLGRVRRWLAESRYDAALFTTQPGVAWVTAGLEDRVVRNEEPGLVWALVTGAGAYLLTSNIELPRLTAEEGATGLGFQLHAVPWHRADALSLAAADLAAGTEAARIATDGAGPGTALPAALAGLRMPLTAAEADRLARLGADCASALEGALREWTPGERECDLAARIAAAMEQRLIAVSVLLVGGSRRRRAFRHPVPTREVTGSDALAVIVGVRGGLNIACSRTVCAGQPSVELDAKHRAACAVEAAMIAATRAGSTWQSALDAGLAAYSAAGFPDEWREHVQGGPIGYLSREFDVVPGTPGAAAVIETGTAFAWNPTVRGGKSEDTFVVTAGGARPVSNTPDWPALTVHTPTGPAQRPAILPI